MYAPYGTPPPTHPQQFYAPPRALFPPNVGQAPQERRIDETFGWFPAATSVGALFFVVGRVMAIVFGDGISIEDTEFIAGGLVVSGLFGFWEIWRRTRPTSLVVLGNQLGIYRKGALSEIAGFGQLTHYRLSVINTVRECIFFGLFALGGGIGFVGTLLNGHISEAFYAFAAFVFGGGGLASCLWSRAMCVHYWIPKGSGTETVVLGRAQLQKIGWPLR